MYNHTTDNTLWVPGSAVLNRAGQTSAPQTGLAAEQAVILQAVAEAEATSPAQRQSRRSLWGRLRARFTQLPA